MSIEISGLTFAGDHLAIQYMDLPTDVRDHGRVAIAHQAQIFLSHPDYREAARKLHDRIVALVEDALENFNDSDPYVPEIEDDDDDLGMGHG